MTRTKEGAWGKEEHRDAEAICGRRSLGRRRSAKRCRRDPGRQAVALAGRTVGLAAAGVEGNGDGDRDGDDSAGGGGDEEDGGAKERSTARAGVWLEQVKYWLSLLCS